MLRYFCIETGQIWYIITWSIDIDCSLLFIWFLLIIKHGGSSALFTYSMMNFSCLSYFLLCTANNIFYIHYHGTETFAGWNVLQSNTNSCMQDLHKHKHTQTHTHGLWAHTMDACLCPKKMKRGAGLGSPTLSISPRLDLTERTAEAS